MGIISSIFGKNEEQISQNMVKFNGSTITQEQLEMKKKEVSLLKGVRIVESAPNVYRTKIEG
jgi:hypothetical protein